MDYANADTNCLQRRFGRRVACIISNSHVECCFVTIVGGVVFVDDGFDEHNFYGAFHNINCSDDDYCDHQHDNDAADVYDGGVAGGIG